MILRADKNRFSRLLVRGQSKTTDLWEILSYSLGTVSYPLSSADGSLGKTNKISSYGFIRNQKVDCSVDRVPSDGAILFDGMVVVQAVRSMQSTIGELAETVLRYTVKLSQHNGGTNKGELAEFLYVVYVR